MLDRLFLRTLDLFVALTVLVGALLPPKTLLELAHNALAALPFLGGTLLALELIGRRHGARCVTVDTGVSRVPPTEGVA